MSKPRSARFVFDASALLSVLEPRFGSSVRTLPGRKLSQLAKSGMMMVPTRAANEAAANSNKARDWLMRNGAHIQIPENLAYDTYVKTVENAGARLPDFVNSTADVEGACIALALKHNQQDHRYDVTNYIVVHDIAYEAACILLGLSTVRPEAFIEAFGALPVANLSTQPKLR